MFSSSECVISRVLSRFYLSEGGTPFSCFFVLATVVLPNAVILEFWPGFGWASVRSRFSMTLFVGILESWTFCVFSRMLLFLEFLLVFHVFSAASRF